MEFFFYQWMLWKMQILDTKSKYLPGIEGILCNCESTPSHTRAMRGGQRFRVSSAQCKKLLPISNVVIFQPFDLEFDLIFDFRSNKKVAISRKNEDSGDEIRIFPRILLFSWKSEKTSKNFASVLVKHWKNIQKHQK